ncbi:hypothetical protein BRC93_04235 [Halobacteriales archaeon QS_5_70_15]|nr:MAG: hypothetical protein BRC93_04235 [Halobacteriales archaeon QS_5_70_15]
MDRRRFCAGLLSALVGGSSGCSSADPGKADRPSRTATATVTDRPPSTPDPELLARLGDPSDVCETGIVEDFGIREIVDPAFGTAWDAYEIDPRYTRVGRRDGLPDDAVVVGLERDGRARAYPVSVLWHHEVVNDTFGPRSTGRRTTSDGDLGVALLVTYCSICRSGLVAERRVRGEPTTFGVSGQLWRPPDRYIVASEKSGRTFGADRWNASEDTRVRNAANLVMYDRATRSFWSQGIGRAICGPMAGASLDIVPSTLTSWGDWRAAHPDTVVLLPPPHSKVGP